MGDGTTTYKTTRGNNGIAQSNWGNEQREAQYVNLPRPTSAASAFEYPYSPDTTDYKSYINASITQLFYTANRYHDLLYVLGFTEQAGNFELNNNGQGGKDNDYVYLHAQDGNDFNSEFLAPPSPCA